MNELQVFGFGMAAGAWMMIGFFLAIRWLTGRDD